MSDKPTPIEIAQAEEPSALHLQAAAELASPQPAQKLKDQALSYATMKPDSVKEHLPESDRRVVDDVLHMLVDAKSSELTNYLKQFADRPTSIENAMNEVVTDMTKAGIDAYWNYSPKGKDFPLLGDGNYDPAAPKDIGHLTLSIGRESGPYTYVRFSTNGKSAAIESSGDWHHDDVPASTGLRTIRDAWIRHTM